MKRLRSVLSVSCLLSVLVVGLVPAPAEAQQSAESTVHRRAAISSSSVQNFEDPLFNGLVPTRLMDTRATGVTIDGRFANTGAYLGSRILQVAGRGGVPSNAGAVVINVTVTNPRAKGYTTVFPAGAARPNASTLNFLPGKTVANSVVAKLGSGGSLAIYNMATTDVIVDVSGWLPAGADYFPLDPARLADSRPDRQTIDGKESGGGAFGGSRAVKVAGRGGVPSSGAGAVVLNVTATNELTAGYMTVFPRGDARPTTSNVNFASNVDKAGLVISKLGPDGSVEVYNSIRSDLVVDVIGWFPSGSDYTGFTPARLVDTRSGRTTIDGRDLAGGLFGGTRNYRVLGRSLVPTRASAVVLNVTVTEGLTSGYTTVYAGGENPRPLASNVNFEKGQTTSNLVVATVGLDGEVAIYNSIGSHLVVDVFGWLPGFVPVKNTPTTSQISVSRAGVAGNVDSTEASISGDGRFTAYASKADNLVAGDSNGFQDIFVHDAQTLEVTRVSVASGGGEADRDSAAPKISADGRYVVFESAARNLVPNDTNSRIDVFVHDRDTGATSRVSLGTDADGHDVEANNDSSSPTVSDDGLFVAFSSEASNLVVGDTNNSKDVFVRDTLTGVTTRESISAGNLQANDESGAPVISGDGTAIVFESFASNLVPGDTNSRSDVFHRSLTDGAVQLVSRSTGGSIGNGASDGADISDDGTVVSFRSAASNLVAGDTNAVIDVFVRNLATGEVERVSESSNGREATRPSNSAVVSGNGQFVAFSSPSENLVSGDFAGWEDVFVRNLASGQTLRLSVGVGGAEADAKSFSPTLSSNGKFAAFGSNAANLVDDGDGSRPQIYKSQI